MSLLERPGGVVVPYRTRQKICQPFTCREALTLRDSKDRRQSRVHCQPITLQASTSNGAVAYPPLLPCDETYEPLHKFSDYANWLIPGTLLVGRYPYVEPSRCKSYQKGERQLEEILQAGINTYVSLQAEVPEQSQMRLAGVNGFMPYKSAAELIKHSMVGPPPSELVNGLRSPTLDKWLPPRHKPANKAYIAYAAREQLSFAHYPIEDLGVPTDRQLDDIVSDLQQRICNGNTIYMHCWGGRGRVGLVGACFLAATYK
eukprot:GHRR01016387.1.p1 GENE.GHRR01016387.1~~GHRR01016387.1.p1  ORF type:complete len:259 (+),score=46.07 GHRR01016387.1:204-980(+)